MNMLRGLLAVLALLLAGCGASVAGSPTVGPLGSTTATPLPPDDVVFQVWTGGGMVPPVMWARSVPGLTIYGNGQIYQADYSNANGSPVILVAQADPAEIAAFVDEVERSGLIGDEDAYGFPSVTDIGSTAVTVHGPDGEATVAVYGLDRSFDEYVERRSEIERRSGLRDLIDRGYAFGVNVQPYRPTALEVLDLGDDTYGSTGTLPTWPGPDPADFGPADRWEGCTEVTADVEALLAAANANDTAAWSTPMGDRVLVVRPLLPGEMACA